MSMKIIIILINEQSDSSFWSFYTIFFSPAKVQIQATSRPFPNVLFPIISTNMNPPLCRKYHEICENSHWRDMLGMCPMTVFIVIIAIYYYYYYYY